MTTDTDDELQRTLREFIEAFDCVAGTLHRAENGRLYLVTSEGMPDSVRENIETIPFGKGMAGRAAERREPVEISNLQTDDSGVAEPRARDTGMEGSIAVPVMSPDNTVKGVIGVAKPEAYEFTDDEREELLAAGERVADRF